MSEQQYEEEPVINTGVLLAAVIENAGGEIKIPSSLLNQNKTVGIEIDLEDDGETIVFRAREQENE